jgi:hypothetical protein
MQHGLARDTIQSLRTSAARALLAQARWYLRLQPRRWDAERASAIDPFLARGGGLVYIHWAVNGRGQQDEMSKRIGLSALGGNIRFRHGELKIDFSPGVGHPIARNFSTIRWVDESYWSLSGNRKQIKLLGT